MTRVTRAKVKRLAKHFGISKKKALALAVDQLAYRTFDQAAVEAGQSYLQDCGLEATRAGARSVLVFQ